MCSIRKKPNVDIDIAGIMPRYIAMESAGYEPIFRFGNSVLQDKILCGTDWPLIDIKRSVKEVMELPLKDEVREKWTYKNAMRLFGLQGLEVGECGYYYVFQVNLNCGGVQFF